MFSTNEAVPYIQEWVPLPRDLIGGIALAVFAMCIGPLIIEYRREGGAYFFLAADSLYGPSLMCAYYSALHHRADCECAI